jgi:exodeoxyribonuclease VII large subunit
VADRRDALRLVDDLSVRLASGLTARTRLAGSRLARSADRLHGSVEGILEGKRNLADRLAAQLEALSPLKVLGRGYAVARDDSGRVLKRQADFIKDQSFRLRVTDGDVRARVE